jgi:curved DNA-binding protein CbpA
LHADSKGYYAILGLSSNASEVEIKKSYRGLVMRFHPDRNKSPVAHGTMVRINIAYEILSDKDKRQEYDAEVYNDDYLTAYATEPNNQNDCNNSQNTDYRNNYYSSYQKSNNNDKGNNSNIPFIVSIMISLSSDIIGSVLYKMNFIDNKLMAGIGLFFVGTLLISLLMKIQDGSESDSE